MNHYTGAVPTTRRAADWRDAAVCRGEEPELFFPAGETGVWAHQIEEAKAVCRRCPSLELCLQWALDTGEDNGVFGGMSAGERRAVLRRRTVSRISVDDYTGIPRTSAKGRTLEESWAAGTETDGDHLLWIGPNVVYQLNRNITPNRLGFYLDRGHWPEGDVKRTCTVDGCVKPAHLADRRERGACGSRSGYQRHLRDKSAICGPCRTANTDADNRLRRTGTTKAAA